MAAPLIEAADCTASGSNTATTTPAISFPAYVSGDLLLFHIASDGQDNHTLPANGPNGETIVSIVDNIDGGTAGSVCVSAFYFIGNATVSASTLSMTIAGAGQEWKATVAKVPAGEFNATTPVDSVAGSLSDPNNQTFVRSPAWTTSSSVTDGLVVVWLSRDTDPITGTAPTGWTNRNNVDIGAVSGCLATRDATAGASESITSADWSSLSDAYSSLGYVVNEPASGITQAIGQVTETDSALALNRAKAKALGLVTETDSALALTARKAASIGLVTETDTALALAAIIKSMAIGLVTETDTALAMTVDSGGIVQAIGLVTETDTAIAFGVLKLAALGLVTETDTALAMTVDSGGIVQAIGLVTETDTALALAAIIKSMAIGLVTETDTALALAGVNKARALGLVTETDAALAVARITKAQTIGQVIETDTALGMTVIGGASPIAPNSAYIIPARRRGRR